VLKRPEYKSLQGLFDKSLPWPAPLIRRSEVIKKQGKYTTNGSDLAMDDDTTIQLMENTSTIGTPANKKQHELASSPNNI
jgi:hypothetical protein